ILLANLIVLRISFDQIETWLTAIAE
ncbi:unnamed protein product, partial [Didymodactylos carnosus]